MGQIKNIKLHIVTDIKTTTDFQKDKDCDWRSKYLCENIYFPVPSKMLGLWHGKSLTDSNILTLTQFISVINYFAGVNLLVWTRKMHGVNMRRHPVGETFVHVYLYVVYLLEVFRVLSTKCWFIIFVYLLFALVMFAYHINMCRNF